MPPTLRVRYAMDVMRALPSVAPVATPCRCRACRLFSDERSRRDHRGYVHSHDYCGPNRRLIGERRVHEAVLTELDDLCVDAGWL